MVKQKVTQYCVPIKNEPGALFRVAQTLAKEGINIMAIMTENVGELAHMRFLADKENAVRRPLENAGYQVFETPVFQIELPNQPGEISRLAKILGDEDINIIGLYGTADSVESAKVVLQVDQPEKAQPILGRLAEKAHVTA